MLKGWVVYSFGTIPNTAFAEDYLLLCPTGVAIFQSILAPNTSDTAGWSMASDFWHCWQFDAVPLYRHFLKRLPSGLPSVKSKKSQNWGVLGVVTIDFPSGDWGSRPIFSHPHKGVICYVTWPNWHKLFLMSDGRRSLA